MDTIIKTENLTKKFGKFVAVESLNLSVGKGEVVGFVGPNGAGKTTTISLLMGFLRPSDGKIFLQNSVVRPETAHKTHRSVGYAAGDMELFDNLTAEQYLLFLKHRFGGASRQTELIKHLKPKMGQKLKHLSRGNKQKIALIGAFQHNPGVAILDEPTSGLDPLMQEVFLNLIRKEQTQGTTIFMSSHILSEVALVCSRVLFMKNGKIIADKNVRELEKTSGKIIVVTADKKTIANMSKFLLDGTQLLSKNSNQLTLRFNGDIKQLLRWLNTRPVTDISVNDQNLDDIFHGMYGAKDER